MTRQVYACGCSCLSSTPTGAGCDRLAGKRWFYCCSQRSLHSLSPLCCLPIDSFVWSRLHPGLDVQEWCESARHSIRGGNMVSSPCASVALQLPQPTSICSQPWNAAVLFCVSSGQVYEQSVDPGGHCIVYTLRTVEVRQSTHTHSRISLRTFGRPELHQDTDGCCAHTFDPPRVTLPSISRVRQRPCCLKIYRLV